MKKMLLVSIVTVLLTVSNGYAMMGGMGGGGILGGFFGLFGGHHGGSGHGGMMQGGSGHSHGSQGSHHGAVAPVSEVTDGHHNGHYHGNNEFLDTSYDDRRGDSGFVDGYNNRHDH
jgi:hypothetical protein